MFDAKEFEEESIPECVLMPWDDKTPIFLESGSGCEEIVTRWEYIQQQLHQTCKITCPNDLIEVIKSYNVFNDGMGKQLKPPWKFTALLQYFDQISKSERNEFLQLRGILGTITNLALQSVQLVPKVKLLKSGFRSSITLHQLQIASLLANAFMCTFPKRDADYPSINFNKLFEGAQRGSENCFVEKIKCIVHYFRRIHEKQPTGNISFHRLCILDHKLPRWDKTTASLCGLRVEIEGKIEDQKGFLQMDFANRFVGGGVLGRGCVQEEIRFIICPELIVARLFTQCLADNEALFVIGVERYCKYAGFSDSFRFGGDYRDETDFDDSKRRKTYLIVLDALYYSHSSEQYRESKILRELKKAYVGFKPLTKSLAPPIATGNWGCGAFRGDPQLKSILQLMASSQARRDLLYLTFGDSSLKEKIDDLYNLLKEREINVGTLYRIIRLYNRNRNKSQTLFDFIKGTIVNHRKRTSEITSVIRKEPDSSKMSEKIDSDYGSVVKRIRKCSVSDSTTPPPEMGESIGNIDLIETSKTESCRRSEIDPNPFRVESQVEMSQVPSQSLLSDMEIGYFQELPPRSPPHLSDHSLEFKVNNGRKLVQPKITDCFFKK